jgi:hypothetical protein
LPLLLLIIAGIVLLLNGSWFHGAELVGFILLVVGGLGFLWFLLVLSFVGSTFRGIKKDFRGGTPRFPEPRRVRGRRF